MLVLAIIWLRIEWFERKWKEECVRHPVKRKIIFRHSLLFNIAINFVLFIDVVWSVTMYWMGPPLCRRHIAVVMQRNEIRCTQWKPLTLRWNKQSVRFSRRPFFLILTLWFHFYVALWVSMICKLFVSLHIFCIIVFCVRKWNGIGCPMSCVCVCVSPPPTRTRISDAHQRHTPTIETYSEQQQQNCGARVGRLNSEMQQIFMPNEGEHILIWFAPKYSYNIILLRCSHSAIFL